MPSKVIDELRAAAAEGVDTRLALRLILSAMAELISQNDKITDTMMIIEGRVAALEHRQNTLERMMGENPSLSWLLRFRTRQTVMIIITVFVILSLWFVSDFRQALLSFAGLPADLLPK